MTRISRAEAEAALLLFLRGLDAGDRALVRRANAALLAYLGQWAGEDQRAEAVRLCGLVWEWNRDIYGRQSVRGDWRV